MQRDPSPSREDVLAETAPTTEAELDEIEAALGRDSVTATRDLLQAYMTEARRYRLLTREQEHDLAILWAEHGNDEARERLVTANLRLVVKLAFQYRNTAGLLDLVQEGNIGLLHAVRKFDPHRGVKLSTYAGWWIRAYMLKHLLKTHRMVKFGTTNAQRKVFYNLRKQQARLRAAGIDPDPETIAAALDVQTEDVIEVDKLLSSPAESLDAPLARYDDGDGTTRLDQLWDEASDTAAPIEDADLQAVLVAKLEQFAATLEGHELELFRERLLSDNPATFTALGRRWGLSRERARQIEKRVLKPLRRYLRTELSDTVLAACGAA